MNDVGGYWIGWSPHASRDVFQAQGAAGCGAEVHVLELNGEGRLVHPIRASDPVEGSLVVWSVDDRWLAYVDGSAGLLIAAAGHERAYPFAADDNYPAWRALP